MEEGSHTPLGWGGTKRPCMEQLELEIWYELIISKCICVLHGSYISLLAWKQTLQYQQAKTLY
jgi:hypothetical protein